MPAPDEPALQPTEAAFAARLADLGLALTPEERAAALRLARALHRAAEIVRASFGQ